MWLVIGGKGVSSTRENMGEGTTHVQRTLFIQTLQRMKTMQERSSQRGR